MNYNVKTYQKMMLICMFVELGESNVKLFDEINTCEKSKELGFRDRTDVENLKFLIKYFKDHKIKVKDFRVPILDGILKDDKNGVLILVKRVKHRTIN